MPDAADVVIQLELAGVGMVRGVGGKDQPLAPRDALLLAWLAIEGPTRRARLAALLWPDSGDDAARSALRQRVFHMRRRFGPGLLTDEAVLALGPTVVHDLRDDTPVLQGVQLDLGAELQHWLSAQRTSRLGRQRHALADRANAAEGARDWPAALAAAQQLLALAPMSEEAHRRVMRLHYLAGDRAAALLAFDACERMLKHDVGARPSAETLALLATVEQTTGARTLTACTAMPASVLRPPRMVGRDRELAQFGTAWAAGHVAAVVGEAGLGKSRLLHEFGATQPNVVMAAGRPGDAGVPFATLARLLRSVTAMAPLAVLPSPTRGEIARVLPEFDPGTLRTPGEGQRLQLLRAVRALLAASPAQGFVADDLHFADAASLDLLAGLIDGEDQAVGVEPAAPRWALAWRAAEAGSALRALHDRLVEQARLVAIALQPLDEAALVELVDSLALPGVNGPALAPGLLRRTGGNPLFVLETLKQALAEHALGESADAKHLPLPQSVGRLIERRIGQLSAGALALARVAAIAGADFSIELAESVLQAGAMQFADALNELEAAQVLRGSAFAHDLVFDAVRSSVPQAVVQLTHARVAAWLEPRGGAPARIAQHWLDAGREAQALPWLDRAAQAAAGGMRPRECIAFRDEQARIALALGDRDAAYAAGYAALEAFLDTDNEPVAAAQRIAALQALARDDAQRAALLVKRALSSLMRGDAASIEQSHEALRLCLDAGDPWLVARARNQLAQALALLSGNRAQAQLGEAAHQLEMALVWIDVRGTPAERGEVHGSLAMVYDNLGRLDEARRHHRISLEQHVAAGHAADAAVAAANAACNRIDAGDLAAAADLLQRARQFVAAIDGAHAQQGIHGMLRALVASHLGHYREAVAEVLAGLESVARNQPGLLARAQLRAALVYAHLGQWARVRQMLSKVPPQTGDTAAVCSQRALLQLRLAESATASRQACRRARDQLQEVLDGLRSEGQPDLVLPLRIEQACGLAADAAAHELQAVAEEAQRIGHRGATMAAHIRRAAVLAGHDASAAGAAARAALLLHEAGVATTVLMPGELWLHAARALHAAGDAQAEVVLARGRAWLLHTAQTQVPDEFRDSFLNRSPVNRDLLALSASARR